MVGTYVKGKCSDCGDWFYTKETDSNGRWIPELDEQGHAIMSNGKVRYKQHVHNCRGQSSSAKTNTFETKLNTLAEDVQSASNSNVNNLWSFAADMAVVKTRTENMDRRIESIEKRLESTEKALDKLIMDIETFLKSISKSWFTNADRLKSTIPNDGDESDVSDEIADTDDTTTLDSHSINFVSSSSSSNNEKP